MKYRMKPVSATIEHCNGCGLPTEDAYSSGHLVLSYLGLAFVLVLRPFFPELVMSTDLMSFEHPSVLLFPREDAGGLGREYVLRIPSVS